MRDRDECMCDLCHKDTSDKPWVLLNRYGYGTGRCRGMSEAHSSEDEYHWDVGDNLDEVEEVVTGVLLCFPGCLQTFLEGKMIEADIRMGHTE